MCSCRWLTSTISLSWLRHLFLFAFPVLSSQTAQLLFFSSVVSNHLILNCSIPLNYLNPPLNDIPVFSLILSTAFPTISSLQYLPAACKSYDVQYIMSALLASNRNFPSSNSNTDICATKACKSHDDGDLNRKTSNLSRTTKKVSVACSNGKTRNNNEVVTSGSGRWLRRIKRCYKILHLGHLISLAFMMLYMFLGALLFLWLEGASDEARKLEQYQFYIHERGSFLKQLDKIYRNTTSQQRKLLLVEEAINSLHQQIGVSFRNQSEWSLTTALYYSGTVLTTIGWFALFHKLT